MNELNIIKTYIFAFKATKNIHYLIVAKKLLNELKNDKTKTIFIDLKAA